MKIFVISLLVIVSCIDTSGDSIEAGLKAKSERGDDLLLSQKIQVNESFAGELYAKHISLPEVPEGFEFLSLSPSKYGDLNYLPSEHQVYMKLKNHDELPEMSVLFESLTIFFGKGDLTYEVQVDLKFTVKAHDHGENQDLAKEYHWMGSDKTNLELDVKDNLLDENMNFKFVIRFEVSDIIRSSLKIEKIEGLESCYVLSEQGLWVECMGSYRWNSAASNSPLYYVTMSEDKKNFHQVLVMVHFKDPLNL